MSLPRSGLLSLWLTATLQGRTGPDEFADVVRGEDPQHLVVGWPGRDTAPLTDLPSLVRGYAATRIGTALPVPGDLVGVAGPPGFNTAALEAAEAVVVGGLPGTPALGLVPRLDSRTVLWDIREAVSPPVADPGEAARTLRRTLITATAELVRLDVASWQPEIPDLLMNLRHRPGLLTPPGTTGEVLDTLERADLCREIASLALEGSGGAVSAYEIDARRSCLIDLDRAARRAMTASCSDNLASR